MVSSLERRKGLGAKHPQFICLEPPRDESLYRRGDKCIIMRPSSLGGGRILRRTLSVRLSVCLSVRPVIVYFTVEPSYERTSKIEKLRFSLMGQRDVCTFRHALRAAYRTAISAAQILVLFEQLRKKNQTKLAPLPP